MKAKRHGPDIRLLRRLGAVFDGIPEERINLDEIYVVENQGEYPVT